ncbi:dihydropteroate synthase [Skermania piniformis]|uniref:dihydropteroate synthase n=1 Tax=Skermania pinensis TaxID=39122 RepID=A0ABX8SHV1_9ACTN|nr:dihydropteroate synthase [Skermania piniformis]QXQ16035.1 dihydropteroate synthase [Skermania piniformis]
MGVLNVTGDSFSDGGRFVDPAAAISHGLALHAAGADLVDVGGESTRPGAHRIDPELEIARIRPVITELAAAGVRLSVDTMRAAVAEAALAAGATVVNDVSGGKADPDMARVVADAQVPWILMHWRADPGHRHSGSTARYGDVTAEVRAELAAQVEYAVAAGVALRRLVIDPGLGFAKEAAHNWALLAGLPDLSIHGLPVLIGASRKRFLGALLADSTGPRPPDRREVATAAISALAALRGAWGVRVHDVPATVDAVRTATAWRRAELVPSGLESAGPGWGGPAR